MINKKLNENIKSITSPRIMKNSSYFNSDEE